MKYFRECTVDDKDEYSTATEIGELYGLKATNHRGIGPKAAAIIRKYIRQYSSEYIETYMSDNGRITLVYPKCIYEKAIRLLTDVTRERFEFQVLVKYKKLAGSNKFSHAIVSVIATSEEEVANIINSSEARGVLDIVGEYCPNSISVASILSKDEQENK